VSSADLTIVLGPSGGRLVILKEDEAILMAEDDSRPRRG